MKMSSADLSTLSRIAEVSADLMEDGIKVYHALSRKDGMAVLTHVVIGIHDLTIANLLSLTPRVNLMAAKRLLSKEYQKEWQTRFLEISQDRISYLVNLNQREKIAG